MRHGWTSKPDTKAYERDWSDLKYVRSNSHLVFLCFSIKTSTSHDLCQRGTTFSTQTQEHVDKYRALMINFTWSRGLVELFSNRLQYGSVRQEPAVLKMRTIQVPKSEYNKMT
jgi:hypothetical protein